MVVFPVPVPPEMTIFFLVRMQILRNSNISRLIANFPNFHFAEIDGTDPIASYKAMVEAVAYCRAGQGPALVHGHVVRPYSHSMSEDQRDYRSAAELDSDALRDPRPVALEPRRWAGTSLRPHSCSYLTGKRPGTSPDCLSRLAGVIIDAGKNRPPVCDGTVTFFDGNLLVPGAFQLVHSRTA